MATLAELTRQHTSLSRDETGHLQHLVSEWGMLADFCFADLLLYVPAGEGRWIVTAHVRPATGQTIYLADWVGAWASETELPLLALSMSTGTVHEGEIHVESLGAPAQMLAIPVRYGERVIAVLTRERTSISSRQPGELERTYLATFDRFAKMIAQGHPLLYYENIEGGHGGAADNAQRAHLQALEYSYLWRQLGR